MVFCFEDCLELAATNSDYSFADADIPLLREAFKRWVNLLEHKKITHKNESYALIFFPGEVEQEVAVKMFEKPSLAWALASLAYVMLRIKANEFLNINSCLPLPVISESMASELEEKGLYTKGRITPRFSLFTYDPPKEGCAFCSLADECPQRKEFFADKTVRIECLPAKFDWGFLCHM